MSQVLILLVAVLGAAGDILIYRGVRSSTTLIAAGMASWCIGLLLFADLMRRGDSRLGIAFMLSAALHILLVVGFDVLVEKSHFSFVEKLGIAITIVGIVLLECGHATVAPVKTQHQQSSLDIVVVKCAT